MAELEIRPTAGQRVRSILVMVMAAILTGILVALLLGGGGSLLAPHTTLTTYMPDGTGLAGYSIVQLGGIPIGKVTRVSISGSLDPRRAVKVEMRVVTRFLEEYPDRFPDRHRQRYAGRLPLHRHRPRKEPYPAA